MSRALAIFLASLLLAACGGEAQQQVTIYLLEGRDTPLGYRGRLVPVERPLPPGTAMPRAALDVLLAADETEGDLVSPVAGVRLRSFRIVGDRALIDFSGRSPVEIEAGAQVLYTVTEQPGIRRVSVSFGGKPCCFWRHDGSTILTVARADLEGWGGEPCHLRTTSTHVRCSERPD
ncbi:MAG: GerMN domain-containing protein [Gaiellaceae bacterium]